MSGGNSGRRSSSRNKAIAVSKLWNLFMPERKNVAPTASRMPNSSRDIGKRRAELRSQSSRGIRATSRDCGSRAKGVIAKSSRIGRPPARKGDTVGGGGWGRLETRDGGRGREGRGFGPWHRAA